MTKKPKTGGEVDAYCTKCKLDLGHRIIAMVGDSIKKVECRTCGSHHLYRRPKAEKEAAHARAAVKRAERAESRGDGPAPRTAAERVTAAQKLERQRTATWEHAIAGKPATAFKAYRINLSFGAGELVRHPKFGDGVVSRVIDRGKVEIMFKDGPKTMAQGQ